jgi:hypothetical protein
MFLKSSNVVFSEQSRFSGVAKSCPLTICFRILGSAGVSVTDINKILCDISVFGKEVQTFRTKLFKSEFHLFHNKSEEFLLSGITAMMPTLFTDGPTYVADFVKVGNKLLNIHTKETNDYVRDPVEHIRIFFRKVTTQGMTYLSSCFS